MSFEQAVRTAVRDLADEGRPVNLAVEALRRGRRLRARRRAVAGVAVFAAAAVLASPLLNGGGRAPRPDHRPAASPPAPVIPAPATTMPGPIQPADGWIIGSVPAEGGKGVWVYDRIAGVYRILPYAQAMPAPKGNLVAVSDGQGWIGVADFVSNMVTWIEQTNSALPPQPWSPDGTRFVYTTDDDPMDDEGVRIVVVDAVAARARPMAGRVRCGDGCFPTWISSEKVGIDVSAKPPQGVQSFAAGDGHSTGLVRLPGWVGQGSPWSPDGEHAVLLMDDGSSTGPLPRAVVEVATGRTVAAFPERGNVYWTAPDRMLVVTDGGIASVYISGARVAFAAWPAEFGGGGWRDATLIRF
jgi:hypothetical protein